jgi:hypothetical protein
MPDLVLPPLAPVAVQATSTAGAHELKWVTARRQ